jgi:DNA-binding MarR family transcriptional regulator
MGGDTHETTEAVLLDELTRRLVLLTRTAGPPLLRWVEENDVSVREARILVALMDSPNASMTAGELAESTGLSVEEGVRAGNDLRARGLICSGRRIQLTTRGKKTIGELENVRAEGLRAYLAALAPAHRKELAHSLEVVAGDVGQATPHSLMRRGMSVGMPQRLPGSPWYPL